MTTRTVKVDLAAGTKGFTRPIDEAARKTDKLRASAERFAAGKYDAKLAVDVRKAESDLQRFTKGIHARVKAAVESLPDVKLSADASEVDQRIAEIRGELASLSDKRIGIDIDATTAATHVANLSEELRRLAGQSPDVKVSASTAAASAALTAIEQKADRIDGRDVQMTARVNGDRALTMIGLITAGLGVMGATAPLAGAAVAGSLAGASAGAQGLGVLAAGLSGVGDAVTALTDQETKAASGSAASGASRVATAQRISGAYRTLEQAQTQADRAAVTGRQQVEDAERSAADAIDQAADDVATARQRVVNAGTEVVRVEADLHEARQRAIRDLQDLSEQVDDNARSIEGADIALLRAQERLTKVNADATASALDRREAALGVKDAQDRLSDAQREAQRDQTALNEAERRGVEGSRDVLAVQFRLNDANREHRAALAGRQDAVEALDRAQTDGARDVARAQQQAGWAQQDAARQVTDAQIALREAMVQTGTDGAAAADKVAEAMAKLSPEGQAFARFLVGELLPAARAVKDEIAGRMLPGVERGLRATIPLLPIFSKGLGDTGEIMGGLAERGGEMMSSGPWRRDFATIMDSNNRSIENFGEAGLSSADAMRHLTVTGGPLVERLSQATERGAALSAQWLATKRSTGELDEFMVVAGDTFAELVETLTQVAVGGAQVAVALGPVGGILLDVVGKLAEMIGNFAEANPTITAWTGGILLATVATAKLGVMVTGLAASSVAAKGGIGILTGGLATLVPATLETRLLTTAKLVDEHGNATERAAGKTGRLVGGLGRVVSYAPAVGLAVGGTALAFEQLTVQSDEAAQSLLDGGVAADQMRGKIAGQQASADALAASVPALSGALRLFSADQDSASAAAQRLYDSLSPLGQAQQDVARATNEHGAAVNRWGPGSWQAASAAGVLTIATGSLEVKQRDAALAAESLTDKLVRQRNEMLGNIDGEIQYEAAVDRLSEALTRNGTTTDLGTAAGRELATALRDQAAAAVENVVRLNEQGAGVDAVTAKAGQYRGALIEAAIATGMSRDQAIRYVDALNLIPGNINTRVHADTAAAQRAVTDFINSNAAREIVLKARVDTGNITAGATPYRGRALGGVDMMAAGGVRSIRRDVAQVVDPNQPVLMGDRMSGKEYFLPDDDSPRTMAIGQRWATDRGLRLVPMAAGGVLGGPAAGVPAMSADPGSVQDLTAAFTSLVSDGLEPLSEHLTGTAVPAMDLTGVHQQRLADTVLTATTGMRDSTEQLRASSASAWTDMQVRSGAEIATMVGPHLGFLADGHRATEASQQALQQLSNASWANMTATTGANVGTITGPILGGLHSGLTGIEGHATRTADWWGSQLGRIRALTADPVRWSLDFPINRGLVPAWNAIDRFFALGRPAGPVPIGFAAGTEDHRATIARGTPRLWNEPETGGEAYIPLAQSKRPRSTDILGSVADEFGLGLVPRDLARFADGGLWRQMFGVVKKQFPAARLTSAYRPGDPGYHGQGKATDLGGPMMAMNRWLANNFANSSQLIYTPGTNLFRGRPHTYNAATRADHVDHVHWAMENVGMLGGAQGNYSGGTGGVFDPMPVIDAKLADTRRMISDIHRFHGQGNIASAMTRIANDAVAGAVTKATSMAAPGGLGPLGAGAPFYVREISRAAKTRAMGPDAATIGTATAIVESGLRMYANRSVPASLGYPHEAVGSDHDSVGLFQQRQAGWGSLAQRMNPYASAGLFFDKLKGFNWRAMDPGAAAQRVQVSAFPGRYAGKMGQARGLVGAHGGFDQGGDWRTGTMGVNTSGETEHVLRGPERRAFLDLVEVLKVHRGPTPRVVPVPATAVSAGAGGGSSPVQTYNVYETTSAASTAAKIARQQAFASRLR